MEDKGFYSFEGSKFQFIRLQESEISCEFKNKIQLRFEYLHCQVMSYVELHEENRH